MDEDAKKRIQEVHGAAFIDPDSFGSIAVELDYITYDDLLEALERQEKRLPLGEILVDMGKLTKWQRDEILMIQESRKAKTPEARTSIELGRQRHMIRALSTYLHSIRAETSLFISDVSQGHACAGPKK